VAKFEIGGLFKTIKVYAVEQRLFHCKTTGQINLASVVQPLS